MTHIHSLAAVVFLTACLGVSASELAAPKQTIITGTIAVTGNTRSTSQEITDLLPSLSQAGGTVSIPLPQLARELFEANRDPTRQLLLEFKPNGDKADINIRVAEESPVKFSLFSNNDGVPSSAGISRVGAAITHNDIFGTRWQVSRNVAPYAPSKMVQSSLSGTIPLRSMGDEITLSASDGYSSLGALYQVFDIYGKSQTYSGCYVRYMDQSLKHVEKLSGCIDYKRTQNIVLFSGQDIGSITDSAPVSLAYSLTRQTYGIEAKVSLNTNIGQYNTQEAYRASKANTRQGWSSYYGKAYYLLSDFKFELEAGYSPDVLLPQESFGLGGARSIRGLWDRQIVADSMVRGTVERSFKLNESLSARLFSDMGIARNNSGINQQVEFHAVGFGMGLHYATKSVSAGVDVARADANIATGHGLRGHAYAAVSF
jgi:hemolysin activation/secretion protein